MKKSRIQPVVSNKPVIKYTKIERIFTEIILQGSSQYFLATFIDFKAIGKVAKAISEYAWINLNPTTRARKMPMAKPTPNEIKPAT